MLMNKFRKKIGVISINMFLIICSTFGTYSAIVSDNDGSAFVTKVEFETLKKNFANQIDNYKSSLENKIDGAIASYLAGIKVDAEPENLWDKVLEETGGNMAFRNSLESIGRDIIETDIKINIARSYKRKLNNYYMGCVARASVVNGIKFNVTYSSDISKIGDETLMYSLTEGSNCTFNSVTSWDQKPWYKLSSSTSKTETKQVGDTINVSDGEGNVWLYEILPSGEKTIRSYQKTYYPTQVLNVYGHSYKDWFTTNSSTWLTRYTTASGVNDTTALSFTMPTLDKVGRVEDITNQKSSDAETSGTWGNMTISYTSIPSTESYQTAQFGILPYTNIYAVNERASLNLSAIVTQSAEKLYVSEQYPQPKGSTERKVEYSGISVKYHQVNLTPEFLPLNRFVNKYLTGIAGENVYYGGGSPLFETFDSDQKIRCRIKFKVQDENGNAVSDNITYSISDKQFVNGNKVADATSIKDNEIVAVPTSGIELDFEADCDKKSVWWINAYANTSGNKVYITDTEFDGL